MPEIITVPVRFDEVKKGDGIYHKHDLAEVTATSHGPKNTKLVLSCIGEDVATIYRPNDKKVVVTRTVETTEDKVAKNAASLAFHEAELVDAALRAEFAERVVSRGILEAGAASYCGAEAALALQLRWVEAWVAQVRTDQDFAEFIMHCKEETMKDLLRGPDDAWSGRGNDARRAAWEGEASLVRDSFNDGIIGKAQWVLSQRERVAKVQRREA